MEWKLMYLYTCDLCKLVENTRCICYLSMASLKIATSNIFFSSHHSNISEKHTVLGFNNDILKSNNYIE